MSKSILVTGGTKGIGKAIILEFANKGFDVFTCSRNEDELRELKEEVEKNFSAVKVYTKKADLSIKEETKAFVAFVKKIGIPDVLVNNTGIFIPGSLHSEDEANFEKTMHTNLFSTYYLTKGFTKELMERKNGHIFTIGSIAGLTAYANGGSYAVSKWAMLGFTKCLRQEMVPHGVKVTSVLPGATFTASWEGVDLPESRFIDVVDVAASVWSAYNLSPRSVVEEIVIRPQLGDI
ncbi:SDR family oxidoreductase [Cyclobacterium marinum]|uniref:Short-chain dehydrogenase/reductase SDR n=1 Tax=Cyclobacterium marinum (strain ATCC 25205 / DSM 745 / LMG 13164 / NCIMB 1802) TaxID=880070 RepID=G0J5X8_CYCMS|nr:SDR family oxidoreductase [Cyclobacterium marinum]AEL26041.1 short-chain dehydrogenase/reductase SDR [Cyclobacterium marinum DSM 745]MBI0399404.1 SDR family oxidoreductase [Cyclobacterium marinum]MBR9774618.1 SDR family oxidoreductase [Cytophagales bacterium]|tara:strand:- start:70866 stop:71570 length:705 start_codon:yes stop_codon:yes gene_type:complete